MEETQFRDIITGHLVPMLPGSKLNSESAASNSSAMVSTINQVNLWIKPAKESAFKIRFSRGQPFTPSEKTLIRLFLEELGGITSQLGEPFFQDLVLGIPRRVVAGLLAAGDGKSNLESVVRSLELLSSQTYEGRPVVTAIGITGSMNHDVITLEELWDEDFARVMSNGFDSMYVCSNDGRVFNIRTLKHPETVGYAPHRLGAIAEWCDNANKVAVVLNRNGEILVFKDRALQFARRRGVWRHYTHESVVTGLGVGSKSLRKAVYESCLDVSFARSGGCVSIVRSADRERVKRIVNDRDLIESGRTTKTKLLKKRIRTDHFQDLDREFRQEMLSMDGATVLSNEGEVIAAGAIVQVPSGSSGGGGRRAAARRLGQHGVAIKISSDGPLTGFKASKVLFEL